LRWHGNTVAVDDLNRRGQELERSADPVSYGAGKRPPVADYVGRRCLVELADGRTRLHGQGGKAMNRLFTRTFKSARIGCVMLLALLAWPAVADDNIQPFSTTTFAGLKEELT